MDVSCYQPHTLPCYLMGKKRDEELTRHSLALGDAIGMLYVWCDTGIERGSKHAPAMVFNDHKKGPHWLCRK